MDALGRIVIPIEFRRELEIAEEGTAVEMIPTEGGLLLRRYEGACIFCNQPTQRTLLGRRVCSVCYEKLESGEARLESPSYTAS